MMRFISIVFYFSLQIFFHYKTLKCDDDHTVIDDSRKHKDTQPMQLVTGKKFKLEVWEACLTSMLKDEVASFTVDPLVGEIFYCMLILNFFYENLSF